MTTAIGSLTTRPSWKALEAHQKKIRETHIRTLFAEDSRRGTSMTAEAVGLFLDYSKNRITDETLKLLLQLAQVGARRHQIVERVERVGGALVSYGLKDRTQGGRIGETQHRA